MESLTPQEQGDVEMMISMMGGDLSPQVALNLLRKHNGSIEKAASALLEGDRGSSSDAMAVSPSPASRPPLRQGTPLREFTFVLHAVLGVDEGRLTFQNRTRMSLTSPGKTKRTNSRAHCEPLSRTKRPSLVPATELLIQTGQWSLPM